MDIIIGTLLDVTSEERSYEGRTWIEHTAHLLDGVRTDRVTLQRPRDGRDPGLDPALVKTYNGQRLALETYSRSSNNTKNVYRTATRILSEDDIASSLGLLSKSA